jgi:glycerol-3-phosphate acyltransferase PlsY
MMYFALLVSYLLGSISTAYLVVKFTKGIDIRTVGSGNAGATNVQRVLGTGPAVVVFILDALKGVLAVVFGRLLGGEILALWCGIAAVVGHDWPLFFGLRGGKGSATTFGVIWAVMPNIALIISTFGILVIALTRYVSLGSILAAPVFPLLVMAGGKSRYHVIFALILMAMTLFKHRSNIKRLVEGKEPKLGQKMKRVK